MSKKVLKFSEFVSGLLKAECVEFIRTDMDGTMKSIVINHDGIDLSVREVWNISKDLASEYPSVYTSIHTATIKYQDFLNLKDTEARKIFLLQHLHCPFSKPFSVHPGNFVSIVKVNNSGIIESAERYTLDQILHLIEKYMDVEMEDEDFN